MRTQRGSSLLEVSLAASLLSVVGLATTGGIRFAIERQEITRHRQILLEAARNELANLSGLADAGTLVSGLSTTTPVNLGPGKTAQVSVVTSTSLEAPNLVFATVTAQLQSGGTPYSIVLHGGFHVVQRPRIISIKFAPLAVPAPDPNAFLGLVPSNNWSISRDGNATNLPSNLGPSTLDVTASHNGGLDIVGNITSTGANAGGESVQYLFRGANWSWPAPAQNTITLSEIPFDKYDIFVYTQVPSLGLGGLGTIRLGNSAEIDLPIPSTDSLARQTYVLGENTLRFKSLAGSTQSIVLSGLLGAPPLHALQVVERK